MARTPLCLAGLLLAWALGAGSAAQAARRPPSEQAEQPANTATAAAAPRYRIKVPRRGGRGGSGETTTQRERRLARECRVLPNAGACLGYGR